MKFIFEVKIKPGHTAEEYAEAWQKGSAIIQREPGAQGTKLHRKIGDPNTLIAIASWESKEKRDAAIKRLAKVPEDVRLVLDRHKELADLQPLGNFEEPEWTVSP